jgi:hypothetical protein
VHGGGVLTVSWHFYPADRWTASVPLYDPAAAFQVTRVSEKSIVISRINGVGFSNAPENLSVGPKNPDGACWKIIAGDAIRVLTTKACPACPPSPAGCTEPKLKEGDPHLALNLDYTVAATFATLPSHIILLAPSGTAYRLDVPDFTDKKDDKAKVIQLKQYDSEWIDIKLPVGKSPNKVEADGKPLIWRVDDNAKGDSESGPTIHVQVTREFTSKPGSVQISVWDAKGQVVGTQQISISCTQWGECIGGR